MSGNNFRASGVWALAVILIRNKPLNRIDLRGNGIDQTSEQALCKLVLGKMGFEIKRKYPWKRRRFKAVEMLSGELSQVAPREHFKMPFARSFQNGCCLLSSLECHPWHSRAS
jgi:hypothetical protein